MNKGISKILAVLTLLAASIALYSCHKSSGTNGYNYNFENLSDKPININIYSSLADYNNGTNIYISGKASVRGYLSIPIQKFTTGKTYYIDYYSDDYTYTNWYWTNVTLRNAFVVTDSDYEFIINAMQFSDPSRSIWLNGAGPQTTWNAVNAYNYSANTYTSIWSQLTPAQQNLQIIIRKDFTATIIDTVSDTTIAYRANYDSIKHVSNITLLNRDKSTFGTITSNFSPGSLSFNGTNDTMMAYFNNIGYFAMVRQ